jgi:ClpP class serine protease
MGRAARRASARQERMENKEENERENLMVKANNHLAAQFVKEHDNLSVEDLDGEERDMVGDLEKGKPAIEVGEVDAFSQSHASFMSNRQSENSSFPVIPDGVTVKTCNNSGRILSFSKAPAKRKSRAEVRADLRKAKELRRKMTWCCKCKMCWITFLFCLGFMIYYNYFIRIELYQNRVNLISQYVNE